MRMARRHCVVVMVVVALQAVAQTSEFGKFVGSVVIELQKDGRGALTMEPFTYVDPTGALWEVPKGAFTDGASIPQVFWILYPPFVGKYRDSAVMHDYYCNVQSRGWRDTHKAFYYAMRANGVDEIVAKTMYSAVFHFGPRWGIGSKKRGPLSEFPPEVQREKLEELGSWIAKSNPSIQDIEDVLSREPRRIQ